MGKTYWDHFMMTGSVRDYLNYRAEHERQAGKSEEREPDFGSYERGTYVKCGPGKETSESDSIDRNGAVHDAGG